MKSHLHVFVSLLCCILFLGIGGCGKEPPGKIAPIFSSGDTVIIGKAFKGPIQGGTVRVSALNADGTNGPVLGTATTASDGSYAVNVRKYSGNLLVEVTGGTYVDEATVKVVPNTTTLRAVISNASGAITVSVTPLTEIAARAAGTLTTANIDSANTLVSDMIGGIDILNTVPSDVTDTSSKTARAMEKDYGLILAAISQMVKDPPAGTTLSDTLKGIADDITSDKMLDKKGPDLSNALSKFISSSDLNQSGITKLDDYNGPQKLDQYT